MIRNYWNFRDYWNWNPIAYCSVSVSTVQGVREQGSSRPTNLHSPNSTGVAICWLVDTFDSKEYPQWDSEASPAASTRKAQAGMTSPRRKWDETAMESCMPRRLRRGATLPFCLLSDSSVAADCTPLHQSSGSIANPSRRVSGAPSVLEQMKQCSSRRLISLLEDCFVLLFWPTSCLVVW
jgi:hypothetical protein